jgi:endonuclease/exonuclease/phosphatase family metal-dependent hydrolase
MLTRFCSLCFVCVLASFTASAPAQPHSITIDSNFEDWQNVPIAHDTSNNNPGSSGIVFDYVKITNDERFLFLKFQINQEINLSENNSVRLYLDTDNNSQTGTPVNGIGAELMFRFGDRFGAFYPPSGGQQTIHFTNIRLRALPAVNSNRFELAIARNAIISGHQLFPSDTIRVLFWDAPGGDMIPQSGSQITYTFAEGNVGTDITPFEREQLTDLRIATFNVWNDGPWQPGKGPRFGRLLAATDADIIHLQEVYDHTTNEAKDFVATWVDEYQPGSGWFAAGNADCKTISRFPIMGSWSLFGGNLATLIWPLPIMDTKVLLINAHLPCCGNDSGRQAQVDAIMAFIRDAKQPGGPFTLDPDTPIVISGDMNFVGDAQQLETLLTGQIVNNAQYGPSFDPDWDGSALVQVWPRQSEKRMGYTWRNDNNSGNYWPANIDFHIYTDSVLDLGRNYTVWTPEMSSASLSQYGLLSTDSLASDHLLFIADFRQAVDDPCPLVGDLNCDGVVDGADLLILLSNWGKCADPESCDADLNGDGTVDGADLLMLLSNWG